MAHTRAAHGTDAANYILFSVAGTTYAATR